uniref:Pleckstrin homology domain containing A2 n=1 Tax=Meleagris gallopavo TaxID=9103 RepID=G1MV29_MELGA
MPYLDRQNRICGFLDIEENETCGKFLRRYFILDTQANCLLWYMDNPQNLAMGAGAVGSLQLTYISKVSVATPKQKPKTPFCFVINALSQRYFLQASDQKDLQDWVEALNRASKITVPKGGAAAPPTTEVTKPPAVLQAQDRKPPVAYKTEIIGGVVVHTPISISQNGGDGAEGSDPTAHPLLRRSQSYIPASASKPPAGPPAIKTGFCVKQGNVRKSWKRRYFVLDEFSISYYKCEQDKEPLRSILLKDICKTHECLVKSGDLLMRDNLFEIITSSRTFYIQADSPEDMHSWIRAIAGAVQALKTRPRVGETHLYPIWHLAMILLTYEPQSTCRAVIPELCKWLRKHRETNQHSLPAGDLLHALLFHDQTRGQLGAIAAAGEENTLQGSSHRLAALDAGATGQEAARGAQPRCSVRAGADGARWSSCARSAPAAPLRAAASQGEDVPLRPGR